MFLSNYQRVSEQFKTLQSPISMFRNPTACFLESFPPLCAQNLPILYFSSPQRKEQLQEDPMLLFKTIRTAIKSEFFRKLKDHFCTLPKPEIHLKYNENSIICCHRMRLLLILRTKRTRTHVHTYAHTYKVERLQNSKTFSDIIRNNKS